MFKIIIIGCGNIGALYDLKSNKILTHAKAFSLIDNFSLYFYDLNISLAKRIAKKYNGNFLKSEKDINLKNYDCVCICSPTTTHFEWLKNAFNSKIAFVVCEKPISNNEKELRELLKLYKKSNTKVLVNFIRRFQISFIELRKYIINLLKKEDLIKISIKYQKGFLNNCIHAIDLIQFLTDSDITFNKNNILSKNYNYSNIDPTISFFGKWKNVEIFILGFVEIDFNIFEIELFFKHTRIEIKNSGNLIDIYTFNSCSNSSNLVKDEKKSKIECLENYMYPIAEIVRTGLEKNNFKDNFVESLNLNLKMIKILK